MRDELPSDTHEYGGQKRVLEMIASGETLPHVLDTLIRIIEMESPWMLGSVLLLENGTQLRHAAAPSLPASYCEAVDGVVIGPSVGSCGTAAFIRGQVIVEDIDTDPLWVDFRELAGKYGLRACWSTPIFDREQRVLGTFALYFRVPAAPTDHHKRLIEMATHTAAIAIVNARNEEEHRGLVHDLGERVKELEVTQAALRESYSRLRELSLRLVEVEEAERRNINRELHDRVGQNLSALNLNLAIVRNQLPQDVLQDLRFRLDDACVLLETTSREVRDVMAELRPAALDDYGLFAALRHHAAAVAKRLSIEVTVEGKALDPRLPPTTETALFRIVQEALNNVGKHARAQRVKIVLAETQGLIRLTVTDDGIGFNAVRSSQDAPAYGIVTMQERAEAVGARLRIASTPGEGTRLEVEVDRRS